MTIYQKGGKLQCWTRKNNRQENYVVCTGTKSKKQKRQTKKIRKKNKTNKVSKKLNKQHNIQETKRQQSPSIVGETKTKKIDNVLQVQENFPELGISSGDWMVDPCYVMNNIKKKLKIKKWSKAQLRKLDKTIPKIKVSRKGRLEYGNYYILYDKEIGSGTYGTVFSGSMMDRNTKKRKNIVIKQVNTTDILEFFSESILQLELFCGMRGLFGYGARIPKMEFVSKYRSRSTGKMKYLVGMEPLDGDCWKFFNSSSIKDIHKFKAIKSVAKLLKTMQQKFKFMHRDLHRGNVMYKNIGSASNPIYRMYIIDFGMSTATFNGYKLNQIVNMYDIPYQFNPTHDLRLFMLSMFRSVSSMKDNYKVFMRSFVSFCLFSILRYSEINQNPFFWDGYYQLIQYKDGIFSPESIMESCDYIIANGEDNLQKNRRLPALKRKNLLAKISTDKSKLYKLNITDGSKKLYDGSIKKLACGKSCLLYEDLNQLLSSIEMVDLMKAYNSSTLLNM